MKHTRKIVLNNKASVDKKKTLEKRKSFFGKTAVRKEPTQLPTQEDWKHKWLKIDTSFTYRQKTPKASTRKTK